uniref:Uncharacterized protein n=1 Tax=viral metagenome TaxID=1070528 RepID=A0A6M3INU9_9ZZZZ
MRRLKHEEHGEVPEAEWTSIQEERLEKNTNIAFFIIDCGCQASTMWKIEYLFDKKHLEQIELKCPACGWIQLMVVNAEIQNGVNTKIVESWNNGVSVQGLSNKKQNEKIKELTCKIKDLHAQLENKQKLPNVDPDGEDGEREITEFPWTGYSPNTIINQAIVSAYTTSYHTTYTQQPIKAQTKFTHSIPQQPSIKSYTQPQQSNKTKLSPHTSVFVLSIVTTMLISIALFLVMLDALK